MTENPQENEWLLPDGFLESKTFLTHDVPTYTIPDNTIKLFNFQSSVPPETPEEKAEQDRAIQEQVKLGILRYVEAPKPTPIQSSNNNLETSFHPDLAVSSTEPKITVLNREIVKEKMPEQDFVKQFFNTNLPSTEIKSIASTLFKNNKKVGRNSPCPCGSGKKYKVCHGR